MQDIPILLFKRGRDRQHAFDKQRTGFRLGTQAGFAPDDSGANGPFSRLVGRFNPCNLNKSPLSDLAFENMSTMSY